MLLQADLDHCDGDAELGRRDEPCWQRLVRGERGAGMNGDVEHDERSGDEEQVGVVGQRAHVQARAENDEEEGDEEAFRDAADLSRQSLRSADCGHDEPGALNRSAISSHSTLDAVDLNRYHPPPTPGLEEAFA